MKLAPVFLALLLTVNALIADELLVRSPDGRLHAILRTAPELSLEVVDGGSRIVSVTSLGLLIKGEPALGPGVQVDRRKTLSVDTVLRPPIREKTALIRDRYNEMTLSFRGRYGLVLRVYDEGIAYRLTSRIDRDIVVENELFALELPDSTSITCQLNPEFWSAYEYPYRTVPLLGMTPDSLANLPLLAMLPSGQRVLVTEADLEKYPGLWLKKGTGPVLKGTFPGYPLTFLDEGNSYTRGKVITHAPEIARTPGRRSYPWRVLIVARSDAELLSNTLVYRLGAPAEHGDLSWIRPGTVTLDWWARRNLFGVDFVGGVNTATAKHLIDFAARYGITYVLLDCGWTKEEDLLSIHPELDMPEVLSYARTKGVGMLLWAVWSTLEQQWDAAFDQLSRWNIAGVKVDFMNRDDQQMVEFYHRFARETARRKMLAVFHGAYKPDGLRRTYPNVITREGLIEFEQNAVNLTDSPEYHTILPFIRMVAGPADYLPGTVRNAQPHEFRMVVNRPMGQGTRAHTMALCVVLESPMRMFPDAPPDYDREEACTRFMAGIPVEWDELRVLHARFGEYVAVARRAGEQWYVGAITDGTARDLELDCSFLQEGRVYELTAVRDGVNAHQRAIDHVITTSTVRSTDRFPIRLAPGGGWVGRFNARK